LKVSIIIPCHDAIGKIERCLASLRLQDFPASEYEVIFVDDQSTDGTFEFLHAECGQHGNWHVLRTDTNSGSPSRPRNLGIEAAQGEFVFFLDCDDRILVDTLSAHYAYAAENGLCVVRGYLLVDNGRSLVEMNRLSPGLMAGERLQLIESIIRSQSTTVSSLIRRELLVRHRILWNEDLRMGEDTLFLIDVLIRSEKVGYIDHPTFIYSKAASRIASSTRMYGARELRNHLEVWETAESRLATLGLSYVRLRFHVGLQTVLQALVRYYRGDIDEVLFDRFSAFIRKHWLIVSGYKLNSRLKSLLELLSENDHARFFLEAKPRLLVAGYDLKFISGMLPALSHRFNIMVDEWTGHDRHDQDRSQAALEWAEIIFCEWLLGNAVWYSRRKRADQRLVVRVHRFELSREFGHLIDDAAVDVYLAVSVLYVERLVETFNISRSKVRLLANHVDVDIYEKKDDPERIFNLALVGALPSRKGLLRSLQLLRELVARDERYNLSIYGKDPHQTDWIRRDAGESTYYTLCDKYIEENGLSEKVVFKGYVDVSRALSDVGFVLSVSDDGHLPESFHLAPSDGFAAGGQGVLLAWSGVEYLYPGDFIFQSVGEMRDYILGSLDYDVFKERSLRGRSFIAEEYSAGLFLRRLNQIFFDLM